MVFMVNTFQGSNRFSFTSLAITQISSAMDLSYVSDTHNTTRPETQLNEPWKFDILIPALSQRLRTASFQVFHTIIIFIYPLKKQRSCFERCYRFIDVRRVFVFADESDQSNVILIVTEVSTSPEINTQHAARGTFLPCLPRVPVSPFSTCLVKRKRSTSLLYLRKGMKTMKPPNH